MRGDKRLAVAAALLTVYLAWGSTYLAIRWVVEALPPFSTAGVRSLIAGSILVSILRACRVRLPTRSELLAAARAGLLLSFGGHALVCFAEQQVPSSTAALIMATIPSQLVLWSWARGGERPSARVLVGLVLGIAGVAHLTGLGAETLAAPPLYLGALLVAATSWSLGSLELGSARQHPTSLMAFGTAMLFGGTASLLAGLARGELSGIQWASVPTVTWLSLVYLVVVGSVFAGGAYAWLLRNAPVRLVATYAFVNPVIAVALGWALGGEAVTSQTLVAGGVLLVGVVLVALAPKRQAPQVAACVSVESIHVRPHARRITNRRVRPAAGGAWSADREHALRGFEDPQPV